jgi:hypothetical protein
VSVDPLTDTEQLSPPSTVPHAGVPVIVREDGSGSEIVASPAPSPSLLTVTTYGIVDPASTAVPSPGVSVFVTVKFGEVARKHSLVSTVSDDPLTGGVMLSDDPW